MNEALTFNISNKHTLWPIALNPGSKIVFEFQNHQIRVNLLAFC